MARSSTSFGPGNNVNPKGRPPAGKALTERLRMLLARKDADGRVYAEVLIETLVKSAAAGDISALREVFDRTEGNPAQTLQGNSEQPLNVTLQWGSKPEWIK